ncbi:succinate dehydrogenase cytochrome b subunit [Adhaeribacter radiodurans]|uniref:Succinate dehydrogenase cytochrome b subunit n=1 Tax=Adhaeribacter radiodurans TaxID=2745197 RepID=A0A7L7L4X8_9BACT|nr:succinate dehydrogenase cytochrome b subunit [Adhaeribacter radiodurans]QMU27655.1 succinate dehydrogenase cytochrome b subunit [Adhaeribacter radiodurans]
MSWFTKTFSSTIGRKVIMSITGLFLCSFLVVHLIGNLQLFKNDAGQAFNIYSEFMGHNPVIRTLEIVLLLGFFFHIYDAYMLTSRNKSARSVKYAVNHLDQNSNWSSRNMGLLGTVILVFLLVHLYNFFWRARFGDIPADSYGNENLYMVVVESFQIWWYVLLYVIAMAALCFHLIHGFASAFQTLGLNHKKYTPAIKAIGYGFSILVCLGFAAMPLYFFFQS